MNFFPLFLATGIALLASCSQRITLVDQVKKTTTSNIASEMGKTLPHPGVGGHHMVRQCLLKPTGKGLKIIPEYTITLLPS